jgi:4,5:9,10-diseco-3-hydroxy-5,9,17-trioxoandrosta-1(10),2-diene-4-oate hydrolase
MTLSGTLTDPPPSRTARVDGCRINYHDMGSGPAMLLVHGAGPGVSGWASFHRNIPALAAAHRVIVPDLPGFGDSDQPGELAEPSRTFAELLRGLLDSLEVHQVRAVGHSLGGSVVLRLALDHPGLVEMLALVASLGFERPHLAPLPTEGSRILDRYFADPSEQRLRAVLETMVYDPAAVPDELVRHRFKSADLPVRRQSARRLHRALSDPRVRQTIDMSSRLDDVAVPTLLVWGRDDRVVPFECALGLLARIPDAELHAYSRCGHAPQLERWAEVNTLLLGFKRRPP